MGFLGLALFSLYVYQRFFNNYNQFTYRATDSLNTFIGPYKVVLERMNEPEHKKTIYGFDRPERSGIDVVTMDNTSIKNFLEESESFKTMRKELLAYYDSVCKELKQTNG